MEKEKNGEIVRVDANPEDWEWDEETATITYKNGITYVPEGNDTFVIPNYFNGKQIKKLKGVNSYAGASYSLNIKAKKIVVSEGIEEIGTYTLGEIGAEEIQLPSTLKKIDNCAFSGNSIKELILPNNVTDIEYAAFDRNSELLTVTIPSSVVNIGINAFAYCSNIQTIECEVPSKPTGWHSDWAKGVTSDKIHWGVDISK